MAFNSCSYCGRTISGAGSVRGNGSANAQTSRDAPACVECKRSKRDRPLVMWLRAVKKNDRNRWAMIEKYHAKKTGGLITLAVRRISEER
ncbi:MAG: hypothetical protein Q7J09_03695 [Methanocalculus sp.]|uniref:hypothetical protein n=1 Tax=Methanocalculus sp. TaxID=2004547 RepID=UPI0027249DB2|nr:hypothetical protein [Methanocalculus sp.]MDO9539090.1 hypothetical protein [Methanocalculus sp.]